MVNNHRRRDLSKGSSGDHMDRDVKCKVAVFLEYSFTKGSKAQLNGDSVKVKRLNFGSHVYSVRQFLTIILQKTGARV